MYVRHTANDTALVITNQKSNEVVYMVYYRSLYRLLLYVFLSQQTICKEKKHNFLLTFMLKQTEQTNKHKAQHKVSLLYVVLY